MESINIPVHSRVNLVEVFATILAKILVGGALFGENADTGAVLPNFADIALHEETRDFIRQLDACKEIRFWIRLPAFCVVFEGRGPRVFIEAADTTDGLVVLLDLVIVGHIVGISANLVADVVLAAGAASWKETIVEVV